MTLHVVCFSGGHSSGLVAIEVVRRYPREEVVLLNHDINDRVEDPDIKRFKQQLADAIGLPITYANHPEVETKDQFDVCEDAGAFKAGNGHVLCTNRLKTLPFERWLKVHAPPGTATLYYGFDAGEGARIQRRATILAAQGYDTAYPLAHWPRTILSTREVRIEPPLTYSTYKHANCVGCLKAGRQHWYVVYCTRPDIWARAKLSEERIGYTILNGVSLVELEPLFADMVRAGVTPTEHVPQQAFWAEARKRVRSLPVLEEERIVIPCECTYRRPAKPGAAARDIPCTCFAPRGQGHALSCPKVLGLDPRHA